MRRARTGRGEKDEVARLNLILRNRLADDKLLADGSRISTSADAARSSRNRCNRSRPQVFRHPIGTWCRAEKSRCRAPPPKQVKARE
jgi:hypothetical protein